MGLMARKHVLGAISVSLIAICSEGQLLGQASVLTWHNDNARTGQNLQETILTPANVNASAFGKLFTIGVDGKVDAQPLYVPSLMIPGRGIHNVLYVATEHDSVYALDADTGVGLWHVSLVGANETPSDDHGCGQVTPEIGITATPVIDPQQGPMGLCTSSQCRRVKRESTITDSMLLIWPRGPRSLADRLRFRRPLLARELRVLEPNKYSTPNSIKNAPPYSFLTVLCIRAGVRIATFPLIQVG